MPGARGRSYFSTPFANHCPHTATGLHVFRQLPEAEKRGHDWIVVATAHPAKFDTIVEPLLGRTIAPPAELAALMERESRFDTIAPDLALLAARL